MEQEIIMATHGRRYAADGEIGMCIDPSRPWLPGNASNFSELNKGLTRVHSRSQDILGLAGNLRVTNNARIAPATLNFDLLKAKQRTLRENFPDPLALRVHRAISWLGRSEAEPDDADVRFILLWISFNSAYTAHIETEGGSERGRFKAYFDTLVTLDGGHRIYNAVWDRFSQEIRLLLDNRYVFAPFWSHLNGEEGNSDWEERLAKSKRSIAAALSDRDTPRILATVFDRLYVLRNQMVHGGATWNSTVNRNQVRDGAAVLGCLLPVFIDIMMDHPTRDWGQPYYPVVE
jgi:hypothetical protein